MQGQRVLWLFLAVALTAIPVLAEEPSAEARSEAEPSTASGMARTDATQLDEDLGGSSSAQAVDRVEEPTATAPAGAAPAGAPSAVITASATTGQDAGAAVMLRCVGPDGLFTFGAGSDDFVAWAFSPGPIDLTQPVGLHYRFGVVPPLGEQCRIFREPFPAGVVPPG